MRQTLLLFAVVSITCGRMFADEIKIDETKIEPKPVSVFGNTTLTHSGAYVLAMRFAGDTHSLFSIGQDGTLLESDTTTGRELARLKIGTNFTDGLAAAEFSNDAQLTVFATHSGKLGVMEVSSRRAFSVGLPFSCSVVDIVVAPSKSKAVLLTEDGQLLLFDISTSRPPRLMAIKRGLQIAGIAYSNDDELLAYSSGKLSSFCLGDQSESNTSDAPDRQKSVLVGRSAARNYLRVGDARRTAIIQTAPDILSKVAVAAGAIPEQLLHLSANITDFHFQDNESKGLIVALCKNNTATVLQIAHSGSKHETSIEDIGELHRIVTNHGLLAIAGTKGIAILRFDNLSQRVCKPKDFNGAALFAAPLSSKRTIVVYAHGVVRMYNADGAVAATHTTDAPISSAALANDDATLLLGLATGRVESVRIRDESLAASWHHDIVKIGPGRRIPSRYPTHVIFLVDLNAFCVASNTGQILLLSKSGEKMATLSTPGEAFVRSAYFSKDLNTLFLSGHGIEAWNLTTKSKVFAQQFLGAHSVDHIASIAQDELVLSAGSQVYRYQPNRADATLLSLPNIESVHRSTISSLSATTDGTHISTADSDGRIAVWKLQPPTLVRVFSHHSPAIKAQLYGDHVFGSFQNGQTVVWKFGKF